MTTSALESKIKPAYFALENDLREDILSGRLVGGQLIRTEAELAEQYGISRNTVRRALDNLAKDRLLRKVRGSGTYVAHAHERRPGRAAPVAETRTVQDRQIVFLSVSTALSEAVFRGTFDPVFGGLNQIFATVGYNLLFAHVGPDWTPPPCLVHHDVGGVIFHGIPERGFWERYLRPIPHVGIQHVDPSLPSHWVKIDNHNFSYQAVERLYALGHRRIGFVSNEIDSVISYERFQGYQAALRRFGLPWREAYVAAWQRPSVNGVLPLETEPDDYTPRLAPGFADPAEAPTAYVCVDDWRAYCTQLALERMGFSVPVDVSLTGQPYMRSVMPSHESALRYSGLDVNLSEICAEAARLLLTLRSSPSESPSKTVLVRPTWIDGGSIAPPPARRLL